MSSSLTRNVCFNSNCKEGFEKGRNGWRRRTGEYAHLCDRCASAYEEGKFCETFHSNASGWRCCESCGKQIHCGCIVSFHMFVLLDAGGIECLTCAKRSYILTPNPLWPPPSQFLPSQPERMKDFSLKTWSTVAGSGQVPWRQTSSLFKDSDIQSDLQPRMPFDIDLTGGIDAFGTCQRLSAASPEKKQEIPDEIFYNGKLKVGPSDTFQNGHTVSSSRAQPFRSINNVCPPIFSKNDFTSNLTVARASSSKIEPHDTIQVSPALSRPPSLSVPLGKQVGSQNRMDSSESQIRNGKFRGDGHGRIELLPCYRPQVTDEELLQISSNSKSIITPLFEKTLSASDAGRIGRLVLPKKCAEAYFPPIAHPEGLPLKVQDMKGKDWVFQFRFWPNNNSRMYVLEGIIPCIQSMQLQAGDVVTFSRLEPEGKLVMGGRKTLNIRSSVQGDEATMKGNDSFSPEEYTAKNNYGEIISLDSDMKGKSPCSFTPINQATKANTGSTFSETLDDKPLIRNKRKGCMVVVKSKRLRIEVDGELKLTMDEAQRLLRPPAKTVPSVFVVEGCEFEEFEDTAPVIGRPTIPAIDHNGQKIQWVQCEDCFKWRKIPADALLPSRWICMENMWDLGRSQCSAAEELTVERLEDILPAHSKVSPNKKETTKQDTDLIVVQEGLDTLANLAIQGEDECAPASSLAKLKYPHHIPGCTCIVCIEPLSEEGFKHAQPCDCTICGTLKSHLETLEILEKRQIEEVSEPASEKLQWKKLIVQGDDTQRGSDTGNIRLDEDVVNKTICLDDHSSKKCTSPLKGQIDLNIQPEREEKSPPIVELGPMKQFHPPHASDRYCMQQMPSGSGVTQILVGNQPQQDGIGSVNLVGFVAVDGNSQETD